MKEMLKLILRKFGYEVYRYHPYPTHLENRGEFDYVETETGKYYLPPDATMQLPKRYAGTKYLISIFSILQLSILKKIP